MKGFTLVEAMVAVAILAISVAAPTYGAGRALVAAQNANNQLTASYLAQEGVEYARAYRDSKYLEHYYSASRATASQDGWDEFKDDVIDECGGTGCYLDLYQGIPLSFCPGSVCPTLYIKEDSGEYTIKSGSGFKPTIYTRTIKTRFVTADQDEVEVVSTVSWPFHGTTYKVEIVGHFTRWLP